MSTDANRVASSVLSENPVPGGRRGIILLMCDRGRIHIGGGGVGGRFVVGNAESGEGDGADDTDLAFWEFCFCPSGKSFESVILMEHPVEVLIHCRYCLVVVVGGFFSL